MYIDKLHLFLTKYQKLIKHLFFLLYFLMFGLYIFGLWAYSSLPQGALFLQEVGSKLGITTVTLLLLTLTPGTMQRFGIFPKISVMLVMFRRQIGILTFLTALSHFGYVYSIPRLLTGTISFSELIQDRPYALTAYIILFTMWLTSNNLSVRVMGKWWKYLQRLSYLAVLLLIVHVILVDSNKVALILTTAIIIEATSWAYAFWKKPA